MLEDSVLHPAAPLLVWMMLACGETPTNADADAISYHPPLWLLHVCLRTTFEIAAAPVQVSL